jgi:hypothetical protein
MQVRLLRTFELLARHAVRGSTPYGEVLFLPIFFWASKVTFRHSLTPRLLAISSTSRQPRIEAGAGR